MKHLIGVAALFLFGFQGASATPAKASSNDFTVGASVDGQGSITQIQNGPEMPAAIVALLQEALPHWRFVPVLRDGKPANVHTFIQTRVQATPTADGKFTVRVDYIGAGPMAVPGAPQATYPSDAIRARESGFVVVSYDVKADGTHVVTDARSLDDGRNGRLTRAVRDWVGRTRDTPETVNGQPVPAHLTTYVRFTLGAEQMLPAGMSPNMLGAMEPPPLDAREKSLLMSAGFTYDDDLERTPLSASVLKPASTPTVTLNP